MPAFKACATLWLGLATKMLTLSTARDILPTMYLLSVAPSGSVVPMVVVGVVLSKGGVDETLESWVTEDVMVAIASHELGHFSPHMFPTVKLAGSTGTVEVASPSQLPTISSSKKQSVTCPSEAEESTLVWMSWQ